MAAGLPVITTQVGGSGDIVDDGATGFLVPPDDRRALGTALDLLVSNPALRRQMGSRGRARAEQRFDAVANARALLQCVSEAVAEEQLRRERQTRPAGAGAVARVLARGLRS
jgi:glycosyltransferase involved in cell wall biosynthesis